MKLFKIRDTTSGLFSSGGSHPRWTTKGKVWGQKGHVTNHLNNVWNRNSVYITAEIVEYDVVEAGATSMAPYLLDMTQRKLDKKKAEEDARRQREIDAEKAMLASLKKKYPGV